MKSLLTILVSISVLCSSLSAVEYGRLTTTFSDPESDSIELAEGDVFEVIYYNVAGLGVKLIIDETTGAFINYDYEDFDIGAQDYGFKNIQSERIIVGPGRLFIVHPATNVYRNYYLSYKLTRRFETNPNSSTILSIPPDLVGSGNLRLVVEGSEDLVSWGILNTLQLSETSQAFFRTTIKTINE
mgnify:CR=1 FL=1